MKRTKNSTGESVAKPGGKKRVTVTTITTGFFTKNKLITMTFIVSCLEILINIKYLDRLVKRMHFLNN